MKMLTVKIPAALDTELRQCVRETRQPRSVIVRAALHGWLLRRRRQAAQNCLAQVADLVGCVEGPRDLATNKKHLDGYGR